MHRLLNEHTTGAMSSTSFNAALLKRPPQEFITALFHPPGYQLHDWQSCFINELRIPHYYIHMFIKGRQIGFTDACIDYALWRMITRSHTRVLFVCTNITMCRRVTERARQRLEHFKRITGLDLVARLTKREIYLKLGSYFKAIRASADAVCGEAADVLIFDEAAFMHGFDDVFNSLFPTVGAEGLFILGSTPCGKDNAFYRRVMSLQDTNAFITHTVPSKSTMSEKRLADCRKHMSDKQFRAELECEFI